MKKTILLIALLTFSSHAQAEDSVREYDAKTILSKRSEKEFRSMNIQDLRAFISFNTDISKGVGDKVPKTRVARRDKCFSVNKKYRVALDCYGSNGKRMFYLRGTIQPDGTHIMNSEIDPSAILH